MYIHTPTYNVEYKFVTGFCQWLRNMPLSLPTFPSFFLFLSIYICIYVFLYVCLNFPLVITAWWLREFKRSQLFSRLCWTRRMALVLILKSYRQQQHPISKTILLLLFLLETFKIRKNKIIRICICFFLPKKRLFALNSFIFSSLYFIHTWATSRQVLQHRSLIPQPMTGKKK